jgi:hypothetical protein
MIAAMQSDRIVSAAERIASGAAEHGLTIRALGGVGCWLHIRRHPEAAPFRRDYGDLDVVVRKGGRGAAEVLASLGYVPAQSFNAVHGERRLMFADPDTGARLDVFLGSFAMCHEVPLPGEAFGGDDVAVAVPELVLTKLQVIEANEKDLRDVAALLAFHDVADIDGGRLARALARDWGLWRTVTANLDRLAGVRLGAPELDAGLAGNLRALREAIDAESKSMRWKARAKVGDRVAWYDTPEEPETEATEVR